MANRSRRTHRIRAERECCQVYPCAHCGVERVVAPVSFFVQFANRYPGQLPREPFEALLPYSGDQGLVSMCPGCFCITSDLSASHDH